MNEACLFFANDIITSFGSTNLYGNMCFPSSFSPALPCLGSGDQIDCETFRNRISSCPTAVVPPCICVRVTTQSRYIRCGETYRHSDFLDLLRSIEIQLDVPGDGITLRIDRRGICTLRAAPNIESQPYTAISLHWEFVLEVLDKASRNCPQRPSR